MIYAAKPVRIRACPHVPLAVHIDGTDVVTPEAVLTRESRKLASSESAQPAMRPDPHRTVLIAGNREHRIIGKSVRLGERAKFSVLVPQQPRAVRSDPNSAVGIFVKRGDRLV